MELMKVIGSMKYASTQVMGNIQMPTIGSYAVGAAHSAVIVLTVLLVVFGCQAGLVHRQG